MTLSAMKEKGSFAALVECLCDTEPLVVCAALGLAHACTVTGTSKDQYELAMTLVQAGALTPIFHICSTAGLTSSDTAEDRPIKVQTLSRLLAVLCNLVSLNDAALKDILSPAKAPHILAFALAPLQNRQLHTEEILIYATQLLAILTDIEGDDADQSTHAACSTFRQLLNQDSIMLLKATMANSNNSILLRSLAINVLLNVSLDSGMEAEALAAIKSASPVLSIALDSFDAAAQLAQLDDLKATTDMQSAQDRKKVQDSMQLWKDALDAQGLLLELLANLLVLGDDAPESEEFAEMDEEADANQLGAYMGRPLFPNVSRFLVESGLASRLLPKCVFPQRGASVAGAAVEDDAEYLSLQQRATGCLLNVVANPEFEQTTAEGASSLWRETVDHIIAPAMERTTGDLATVYDILSNSLAVLTQLLRLALNGGAPEALPITVSDFRGFISIANSQAVPDGARISAMTIMGLATGGPWSQQLGDEGSSVVSEVLNLFMDAIRGESITLAAEAANAIMDAFAEPTFNSLTNSTLGPALTSFISVLKTRISADRKNLSRMELDRLDETRVNLTRFLAYKRSQ